jgi:hypothetical protein
MALHNGLNWVIPIRFDPEARIVKELEQLMPDFWKFELETKKKFTPKDVKSGKPQLFDLSDFIDKIDPKKNLAMKELNYAMYLGSEDTPPCRDFVFYIVNNLPLNVPNCQFKIFRENALLSTRDRETHARSLRENTLSGPPEIRKVVDGPIVSVLPNPLLKRSLTLNINKTIWTGQKTAPPSEPNYVPNCNLKRILTR